LRHQSAADTAAAAPEAVAALAWRVLLSTAPRCDPAPRFDGSGGGGSADKLRVAPATAVVKTLRGPRGSSASSEVGISLAGVGGSDVPSGEDEEEDDDRAEIEAACDLNETTPDGIQTHEKPLCLS
jgi:hypothetical protein